MGTASWLLIISLAFVCFDGMVDGSYTLRIQFNQYTNPGSLEENGECCDCVYIFNTCVSSCYQCETLFTTLCFREGGTSHSQTGQCISGTVYSPGSIGADNVQFTNTIGSISNPLTLSGDSIPMSGFQLYLVVEDYDTTNSNDLIDRIIVDIPKDTTPVISQTVTGIFNSRVSLVLSYSLSCNQHYYGSDCSVNCIPHNDDINGHYTCNDITGAIICRDGWQNPKNNCREVDCHLICDSTGGQCINGSCVCNTGWSGDTCNMPQCAIGCNPQGGYCTVPNECLCNQNWNGTNCSEPLCAVNCSSIGGICPTADNCTCLQGYTGDSCETDLYPCDHQMPCLNGANCSHTDDIGEYNCSCSIGYTGENCETDIDECSMGPCLNNGTCLNDVPGSFICICNIGWTGELCQHVIDYCDSNPCMNNGSCHNLINGHYCSCPIQYEGLNCELTVNVCVPNPCQNNATCTNHYINYTCTCTEDYTGNNCETKMNVTIPVTNMPVLLVVIGIVSGTVGGFLLLILITLIVIVLIYAVKKEKSKNGKQKQEKIQYDMKDNPTYNSVPSQEDVRNNYKYHELKDNESSNALKTVDNQLYDMTNTESSTELNEFTSSVVSNPVYGENLTEYSSTSKDAIPNPVYGENLTEYSSTSNPVYGGNTSYGSPKYDYIGTVERVPPSTSPGNTYQYIH